MYTTYFEHSLPTTLLLRSHTIKAPTLSQVTLLLCFLSFVSSHLPSAAAMAGGVPQHVIRQSFKIAI